MARQLMVTTARSTFTTSCNTSFLMVMARSHFRVVPSLCFKARLSVKPLIWKWFYILMQIKLICTRKVLHLASFWKWEFLELWNGLQTQINRPSTTGHRINTVNESVTLHYRTHGIHDFGRWLLFVVRRVVLSCKLSCVSLCSICSWLV